MFLAILLITVCCSETPNTLDVGRQPAAVSRSIDSETAPGVRPPKPAGQSPVGAASGTCGQKDPASDQAPKGSRSTSASSGQGPLSPGLANDGARRAVVEQMRRRAARASRDAQGARRRQTFHQQDAQRKAATGGLRNERPWWTAPASRSYANPDACTTEPTKYIKHLQDAGWGESQRVELMPASRWGRRLCALR